MWSKCPWCQTSCIWQVGPHARQELHIILGCGENFIGVVVSRHSKFPDKPSLDRAKLKFLSENSHSSGLHRSKTTYDGKLFMCSYRRIQMDSISMAQVIPYSDHHYFDESKMQVSIMKSRYPNVNYLSNQAMNVRDNSGQIQMGIIKKAVWKISGEKIE